MNLRGPTRIVAENVDHHRHVDVAGLENRLAIVKSFEFSKFVDILFKQIRKTPNQAPAFARGHLPPRTFAIFESTAGRIDGAVHIGGRGFRDLR